MTVAAGRCEGMDALGGADTRIRTGDLPLTRRLLYQLSYAGMNAAHDRDRTAESRRHSSERPAVALMKAGAVQRARLTSAAARTQDRIIDGDVAGDIDPARGDTQRLRPRGESGSLQC